MLNILSGELPEGSFSFNVLKLEYRLFEGCAVLILGTEGCLAAFLQPSSEAVCWDSYF